MVAADARVLRAAAVRLDVAAGARALKRSDAKACLVCNSVRGWCCRQRFSWRADAPDTS
jgi:hypothetical protein